MLNWMKGSFYRKIQLSFLLLVLLPICGSAALTYVLIKHNIEGNIQQKNDAYLALIAKDISKTMDSLDIAIRYFVQDKNVLQHLRMLKEVENVYSFDQLMSYLEVQSSFGLVLGKVLIPDAHLFIATPRQLVIEGESGAILPLIREMLPRIAPQVNRKLNGSSQLLGMLGESENRMYYAARVIQAPDSVDDLGTFYILIPEAYFKRLFAQQNGGHFALYDSDGRFIAGTEAVLYKGGGRSREIRSETRLAGTNWTLVYELPKDQVTGEIKRMFTVASVVAFVFFFVFLLMSVALARNLHRPIRQLQRMVKQVGEGNLHLRYESGATDELAQLGRTLNDMLDEINGLMRHQELKQREIRRLELNALAAQISPHFLLNTLNSIRCSLSVAEDERHSRQLQSVMSLLRAYMKPEKAVTLGSECGLLEDYIEIMKMRNRLNVIFRISLADEVKELEVPRLLLQPIVENAFVHGFRDMSGEACIWLAAEAVHHEAVILIGNNGARMDDEALALLKERLSDPHAPAGRVGLSNIAQRLRLTYGEQASLTCRPWEAGGMLFEMRIPAAREKDGAKGRDTTDVQGDAGG